MLSTVRAKIVVAVAVVIALSGCGGRISVPVPEPKTEPRAAWIIRAGPDYTSEREVCRSNANRRCVLQASAETRPMHVVVSVQLYPADGKTTYSGAFVSGFTQSASRIGHETKVDYTIETSTRPSFVSSSGRVTTVPGKYEFRMAMFATVAGHTDPHQFEQVIPVEVVAPNSTSGSATVQSAPAG